MNVKTHIPLFPKQTTSLAGIKILWEIESYLKIQGSTFSNRCRDFLLADICRSPMLFRVCTSTIGSHNGQHECNLFSFRVTRVLCMKIHRPRLHDSLEWGNEAKRQQGDDGQSFHDILLSLTSMYGQPVHKKHCHILPTPMIIVKRFFISIHNSFIYNLIDFIRQTILSKIVFSVYGIRCVFLLDRGFTDGQCKGCLFPDAGG